MLVNTQLQKQKYSHHLSTQFIQFLKRRLYAFTKVCLLHLMNNQEVDVKTPYDNPSV